MRATTRRSGPLARRATALAAASLVALAAAAYAQPRAFEAELRYWSPELSGEVQVRSAGQGTLIDFETDLGIEDSENGEARLLWRPSRRTLFRLAYMPLDYSGDGILSRTLVFAGQTFEIDARLLSELELEHARAGFAWLLLSSRDGRFRLGPLLEVVALRGEASLEAPQLTFLPAAREELEAAYGAAGLLLEIEPSPRWRIHAEATALVGLDQGDAQDAEAGVSWMPTRHLTLSLGYRTLAFDAEEGDDRLEIDLSGPWLAIRLGT